MALEGKPRRLAFDGISEELCRHCPDTVLEAFGSAFGGEPVEEGDEGDGGG
jgi:hypothetical protein